MNASDVMTSPVPGLRGVTDHRLPDVPADRDIEHFMKTSTEFLLLGQEAGTGDSTLALEEGIPTATMARLAEMGHKVRPVSGRARGVFGDGQIILRDSDTGVLFGGSDPRKDGLTAAF